MSMSFLFPRLHLKDLPLMLGSADIGSFIAGAYGILHDQITFSLSEEYFTKFKFQQFSYADFGWPQRVFAGEVGFLATWWVGFISGWLLSRVIVTKQQGIVSFGSIFRGFGVILSCAVFAGLIGFTLGKCTLPTSDLSGWQHFATVYEVERLQEFALVGYIHNASYLGGLIGLVPAILYLKKKT